MFVLYRSSVRTIFETLLTTHFCIHKTIECHIQINEMPYNSVHQISQPLGYRKHLETSFATLLTKFFIGIRSFDVIKYTYIHLFLKYLVQRHLFYHIGVHHYLIINMSDVIEQDYILIISFVYIAIRPNLRQVILILCFHKHLIMISHDLVVRDHKTKPFGNVSCSTQI